MKKLIATLSMLFVFTIAYSIPSDTIYKDVKSLYKEDLKDVIAFTADKAEQGTKYLFTKADSIVNRTYNAVSKGSIHTYEILKTQQLVKSVHHLFYFLLGILMTFVLFSRIKIYLKQSDDDNGWTLLIICCIYAFLLTINTLNFNEMLTGFINPEYGAIKEVIEFIKQ